MATDPYATIVYANAFFSERLGTEVWDASNDTQKEKAVKHATQLINRLNFVGSKADVNQVNEFPRNDDATVPEEVKQACALVAQSLLAGDDPNTISKQAGLASKSVGDASESYTGTGGKSQWLEDNFGLPNSEAADLLRPWIHDPETFELGRTG